MNKWALVLVSSAWVGCLDAEPGAAPDAEVSDIPFGPIDAGDELDDDAALSEDAATDALDPSCEQLSADDCLLDPRCRWIEGFRYDAARQCRDETTPFGCRTMSREWVPISSAAVDEAGHTWGLLGAGDWLPAGWTADPAHRGLVYTAVDFPSCAGASKRCEERSPEECSAAEHCLAIVGAPVDEVRKCLEPPIVLSCTLNRVCTFSLSLSRDAAGQLWSFGSGCLPDGWTEELLELDGHAYGSVPSAWSVPCE